MTARRASILRDTRGAIFVETLIAYVPVLWFFLILWQLCELLAADLVVRRAASAAARAATVVLSDDPSFYGGSSAKDGNMRADIKHAAERILRAAPQLEIIDVKHELAAAPNSKAKAPGQVVTATVTANFKCAGGWLTIICGGNSRAVTHAATYAYQGAAYNYDL
jgi:Flp pilus assembly protein TadG